MNSKTWTRIIALTLFAALAMPVRLPAQDKAKPHHHHQYHHYQLVDIGTFGGPNSSFLEPLPGPGSRILNSSGTAMGSGDTPTPDPYCAFFNFDCYVAYGFKWQDGVASELGALPGFNGLNSATGFWVSDSGLTVGVSTNGLDPLTGNPAWEAILWGKDGYLTDLGTLGGNESSAYAVNNRGQVAGVALNAIPDPYTSNFLISGATQAHAFRWTESRGMQDLGTLGGTDCAAVSINARGQIAGWSFTNTTVNPGTGLPTLDPFLWENGKMLDLGTLGGTVSQAWALNNRGHIAGYSNLAGDNTGQHAFLWDQKGGMQDLGTLGGAGGAALSINDADDVVGVDSTADGLERAFLWRHGVMTNLGTIGTDPGSEALSINSQGQVVGDTRDPIADVFLRAFLWEHGGPMVDLNTLVPRNSSSQLIKAIYVNDRGEIAVRGVLSNGNLYKLHAVLLIPCDEDHPGVEGCDYSLVDAATAAAQSAERPYVPRAPQHLPQSRRSKGYHMPGRQSPGR
jgi:probable HAF family extracellular repeat protein